MVTPASTAKPYRLLIYSPNGAPAASAPKIAIPFHDITLPERFGPTSPIPQVSVPVSSWLSPKPRIKRPTINRPNLTIVSTGSSAAPSHAAPAKAQANMPCRAERLPPY